MVTPIWPAGDAATTSSGVSVSTSDGASASVGDRVTLAGGFGESQYEEQPCGATAQAQAFEVDQIIPTT